MYSGKPMVTITQILSQKYSEKQFYKLVAGAELGSEHPIGQAIVQHAKQMENIDLIPPDKFEVENTVA